MSGLGRKAVTTARTGSRPMPRKFWRWLTRRRTSPWARSRHTLTLTHVATRASVSNAKGSDRSRRRVRGNPGRSCTRGVGRHHRFQHHLDDEPAGPCREEPEGGQEHRYRRLDGTDLQGGQDPQRRDALAMWAADCDRPPSPADGMRVSAVPAMGMDDLPAARRTGTTVGVRPTNVVFGRVILRGGGRCLPAPERRERRRIRH